MLKEEVYIDVADQFGTSVGVANILGYKGKREHKDKYTKEVYKEFSDELDINGIICEAIEMGKYQELQREIYKLNLKRNKRIKEITIYNKAFNIINVSTTNNI